MSEGLIEVILPLMGEGITEANLVKWLKQPGDKVEKDEAIVEISTDKVDTEISAPSAGFLLKTYAAEGDSVTVNGILAYLGESKEMQAPDKVDAPMPIAETSDNRPLASASPAPSAPPPSNGNLRRPQNR